MTASRSCRRRPRKRLASGLALAVGTASQRGNVPTNRHGCPAEALAYGYRVSVDGRRVVCSGCGEVLFDGLTGTIPAGVLPPEKEPCPDCGGLSRTVKRTVTAVVQIDSSASIGISGEYRHSKKHRTSRDLVVQTRVGKDGRRVRRTLDNAREHSPPFKWHRVVDAETGDVIKNQLIDHASRRIYDFRDPSVEVPEWFPHDPHA